MGELVLEHSECAGVLARHRIDYCCKGHLSLDEACAQRGLEPAAVAAELEAAISTRHDGEGGQLDPRTMSTAALLGHIVATHHDYARGALAFVGAIAAKVARVHGDREPRLVELLRLVQELEANLIPHLDKEERELFPALLSSTGSSHLIDALLGPIADDHESVGLLLRRVRDVTDDFTPPGWACTSYRTLFAELEALEADTHRHVHLENHVLIPRITEASGARRGYAAAE